jgi:hypothetical protein
MKPNEEGEDEALKKVMKPNEEGEDQKMKL